MSSASAETRRLNASAELTRGARCALCSRMRGARRIDAYGHQHRPSGRRRRSDRRAAGNGDPGLPSGFFRNITIAGGVAPVRAYIPELLPDVLEGRIQPGRVLDRVTDLDGVPDGYRAMNERESIKVMIAVLMARSCTLE